MERIKILKKELLNVFEDNVFINTSFNELSLEIPNNNWLSFCNILRTNEKFNFEFCIDLCGVDYLYWNQTESNPIFNGFKQFSRFAVVAHLLSIKNNWRLRVRTSAQDFNGKFSVDSLISCWPSVGWFEREAFDLFGIFFKDHPDLRRILTDYGFIGYPFRKDFPLSGNVEVRFDSPKGRVVYQPVTIAPREVTPRVVREDLYAKN